MSTPGAESLLRDDPHDEALLARVHPADWVQPEPADRYHLVVLGGGTAGLVAAAGAAGLGARVALVERALLGGDCLNTGCVPSKGVIRAGKAAKAARGASKFGVVGEAPSVDFGAVMGRMRQVRASISRHDSAERFRDKGIDVFLGEAKFVGRDTLEVGGLTLRFRKAVLATGAAPFVVPIPGLETLGDRLLTSDTVFKLTELPPRLAVIGAGPIGCELAQSFARLGSEVTVFDRVDRPVPRDDPDASALVRESLEADGVKFVFGAAIEGAALDGEQVVLHGEPEGWRGDRVLVATGRRPRLAGLGLEAAGVDLEKGRLITDARLRTTNPRIYASGDVVGGPQFTHAADAMSRLVIGNALFGLRGRVDSLQVPWATYTDPEVAHVGPAYDDLDQEAIETWTVDFAEVDRAELDGDKGFVRAHVRKGTDKLVAATVVGPGAGDTIAVLLQPER